MVDRAALMEKPVESASGVQEHTTLPQRYATTLSVLMRRESAIGRGDESAKAAPVVPRDEIAFVRVTPEAT